MIDPQTCQIIQQVLRDESRTLLLYACEAFPRFTAAEKGRRNWRRACKPGRIRNWPRGGRRLSG